MSIQGDTSATGDVLAIDEAEDEGIQHPTDPTSDQPASEIATYDPTAESIEL